MEASVRRQFEYLAIMRSPENLAGDGEYSRRQQQARHAAIMKDWRALEKLLGRKVSLDEIEAGVKEKNEYPPYYMIGRGAA
jgi:hypothetical protein